MLEVKNSVCERQMQHHHPQPEQEMLLTLLFVTYVNIKEKGNKVSQPPKSIIFLNSKTKLHLKRKTKTNFKKLQEQLSFSKFFFLRVYCVIFIFIFITLF